MRTAKNAGGRAIDGCNCPPRARRALLALALALLGCAAIASAAQAAAPAWKLLAATGPTNLPPKQSEVQRVTVEAEGGAFTLTPTMADGHGSLSYALGVVEIFEGSNQAHVYFTFPGGAFKVGQTFFGEGIPAGTTIVGIGGTPSEPDLELSNNATESGNLLRSGASKEVTGVTTSAGQFAVGQEVSGPGVEPGTTVTAVGSGTLTLSAYPTGAGTGDLKGTATTTPIPYDASAATLQGALEAVPGFTPGMFAVSGGPGGDTEHPYSVSFGGSFAEADVGKLVADGGGLLGEHASVAVFTVVPGGPGTGEITINPANVGGATTLGPITLNFGPLPPGIRMAGPVKGEDWTCSGGAGESSFTCTTNAQTRAFSPATSLKFPVEVEPALASSSSAPVEISGGGAAGSATYEMPIVVSKEQAPAGIQAFWAGAFDDEGNREVQAGGHAHSAQSYFLLNTVRAGSGEIVPAGVSKNVIVDLPPGFLGNPTVTKRCPQAQVTPGFSGPSPLCNQEMSVGTFQPLVKFFGLSSSETLLRIYNNEPPQGYAAEFTAKIVAPNQSLLASVRSDGDYGVRITAPNNPNFYKIYGSYAALEGEPLAANGKAFLTNPTDCAEEARRAPTASFRSDTWESAGQFSSTVYEVLPPVTGCDKLEFHPSFDFQPSASTGSSPVGATAHLHIPQDGLTDPDELATPALKKAAVTLPQGLALNPSSANGLQACSQAQIGYVGPGEMPNPTRFNEASPTCPDGSKLGTVEVKTPVLDAPLHGTVYLAAQEDNPFNSLLAIYLVIDDARTGITMKLPGEVKPDPNTGQLTAIFDNNPQLPFEDLTLEFRGGGPRSLLATPEVCGTHTTNGTWTPWSAPESGPPANTTNSFEVSGNCSASMSTRPFSPSFEAGTTDPIAGAHSPMVIKVARKDGEQELQSLEFKMPPGITGKLGGIAYCSDAAIASAQSKSGKAEQASPSCPSASRLGSVQASAGVGPEPFSVGGNIYLSGPYKGAPLSAVVITPAVAGPFDLGNVVVRSPLYVDPVTAQISAKSDPLPTILEGIPLKVREVTVNIDRKDFTINPTSCEAMQVSASIGSSNGATSNPENRFQVGGCEKLSFKPKTTFQLIGGTKRGAHPTVKTTYTAGRPGEANLMQGSFTIPRSEFLDQAHIRTVCTRVQFAADACPPGSIYGHVTATSPIVDYAVSGPVYLRSSNHKLPDLVFALKGPDYQPVEIEVALRIDSIKGQIRVTVDDAPDLPVSRLVFVQKGGKKGLLVNSRDICERDFRATIKTEGHNGKASSTRPVLRNAKCNKQRKAKRKQRRP